MAGAAIGRSLASCKRMLGSVTSSVDSRQDTAAEATAPPAAGGFGSYSAPKSIAWSIGSQFGVTLFTMASNVVMARLLQPSDFGIYAFAGAIYAMVQWLLQMGVAGYVLRERNLTAIKLNSAYLAATAQGAAATAIVIILAPVAGWFSRSATTGLVTLIVAFVPFLNSAEAIVDVMWLRENRYSRIAILQIAKAVILATVSIGTQVAFGWGIYSLVAGLMASATTAFVVSNGWLLLYRNVRPVTDRQHWRELRSFTNRSFVLTLCQIAAQRLPELSIARLTGLQALGLYSRASSTLDVVVRMLISSVTRATVPAMLRRVHAGEPMHLAVAELCNTVLFFAWPAMAGVAVLSEPMIRLLYGAQWVSAGQALPVLCIAYAIDMSRTGGTETLLVRDRIGLNAAIELVHAIGGVLLMVMLAPYGLMAVAWGRVGDSLWALILYWTAMHRYGALPWGHWPRLALVNGLLALGAGGPAALLMAHWHWPVQLSFGGFAATIGSGVAGWLAILALLRHPFLVRGIAIARQRMPLALAR